MKKSFLIYSLILCISVCLASFIGYSTGTRDKLNVPHEKNYETLAEQTPQIQETPENIKQEANQVADDNIIEKKHPIDIEEQKCIDTSHVYDYPLCSQKAEKAWDEEIQKNLALLKKVMPKEDYKYIAEMDEKRKESFQTEIAAINKFVYEKDGIIYQTGASNHISELKKQYALHLRYIYYEYYED